MLSSCFLYPHFVLSPSAEPRTSVIVCFNSKISIWFFYVLSFSLTILSLWWRVLLFMCFKHVLLLVEAFMMAALKIFGRVSMCFCHLGIGICWCSSFVWGIPGSCYDEGFLLETECLYHVVRPSILKSRVAHLCTLITARSRWKSRLPSECPGTSRRRGRSLCCWVGMRALVTCALCPLPLPCLAWRALGARTAQSWLAVPALVSETPPCWCWGTHYSLQRVAVWVPIHPFAGMGRVRPGVSSSCSVWSRAVLC